MKFRNLPSIITLISGLFVCIITLIYQYTIDESLWIIIIVMVVFFLIGLVLRKILNKVFEERTIENEENDYTDSDENDNGNL